jgi:ABC-type Na+ efflux pump permease subunit
MKAKHHAYTLVVAALFAAFHVLVVVPVLFETGGHGEHQGLVVAILDMPLVPVWDLIAPGNPMGLAAAERRLLHYVWFFSIAGTLMYAAVGALVGQIVDRVRRRFRAEKRGHH